MKCPKCGYLGFETTDRCRNCQYDFSLAPFSSDQPDLALRRKPESPGDFELPPISRQADSLSATALDLDRLFGEPDPPSASARAEGDELRRDRAVAGAAGEGGPSTEEPPLIVETIEESPAPTMIAAEPEPEPIAIEPIPVPIEDAPVVAATPIVEQNQTVEPLEPLEPVEPVESADALPFDDAPIVPPPAARTPLAVRRSTPEVPRNRPRTTRPARFTSLNLEAPGEARTDSTAQAASETVASLMQTPSLGARVGAGAIDAALLLAIDAAIAYFTLRVTGLQNTLADLRVLPPIPFVGFLAVLAFGYVAAFTVGGGQTIGKMILSLRVIGDDGRPVDAAGGMLRAAGCMLVPATLGLSYIPVLFTSDHRALHDRLAGTRVVQE